MLPICMSWTWLEDTKMFLIALDISGYRIGLANASPTTNTNTMTGSLWFLRDLLDLRLLNTPPPVGIGVLRADRFHGLSIA